MNDHSIVEVQSTYKLNLLQRCNLGLSAIYQKNHNSVRDMRSDKRCNMLQELQANTRHSNLTQSQANNPMSEVQPIAEMQSQAKMQSNTRSAINLKMCNLTQNLLTNDAHTMVKVRHH